MTQSFQKLSIQISPNYLIQISSTIQTLSHFYQQQQLQSLTPEYRNLLFSSFSALNQSIQMYSNYIDPSTMITAAIVKCRSQMEIYCLEKLSFLLRRESQDLGKIIDFIIKGYKTNISEFEMIVLAQRRKRAQTIENEKDKIIQKLREQLLHRKEYISQIKDRLQDVQNENTKIYQKIIVNAKNSTDRALSPSPKKNSSSIFNPSLVKLKNQAMMGTAHKTLSAKQVQQTIIDIMQTKQKQETVKGKKVSLKNFLKTYFRYKFGMKQLADQTELNFKQAVEFFSQSQQKNIFILFTKMYYEQCQQQYFWQLRYFYERLVKVIKRYLNEKEGISLDQLQRIYDSKFLDQRSDVRLAQRDVQHILITIFKLYNTESLQMILNQIITPKIRKSKTNLSQYSQQIMIPSKKLINQLLNYQLNGHIQNVGDIVRMIKDVDTQRGYLNQQNLQTIIARLNIPEDKIQANLDIFQLYEGKFLTYSQAIQIIEKIRTSKPKKNNYNKTR